MSASPESTTNGPPVATSNCDVCSVSRDADGVVIHFGQSGASPLDPRAIGVVLRHRVVLGEQAAARLQDLMSALLEERATTRDAIT